MSDLTTAEYLSVACAYLRGLNSPCRTPAEGDRAAAKLEADARALWAVRVIWAHARKHGHITPAPQPHERKDEWSIVVPLYATHTDEPVEWQDFERSTPEAVTIAAAEALVAADPSLDPDAPRGAPIASWRHRCPDCSALHTPGTGACSIKQCASCEANARAGHK